MLSMKKHQMQIFQWMLAIGILWLAVWIQLPRLGPEKHIVDKVHDRIVVFVQDLCDVLK